MIDFDTEFLFGKNKVAVEHVGERIELNYRDQWQNPRRVHIRKSAVESVYAERYVEHENDFSKSDFFMVFRWCGKYITVGICENSYYKLVASYESHR